MQLCLTLIMEEKSRQITIGRKGRNFSFTIIKKVCLCCLNICLYLCYFKKCVALLSACLNAKMKKERGGGEKKGNCL